LLIESEIPRASAERVDAAPTIIRLEGISVEYRAPRERITTFKEYAIRLLQRRVRHDQFRALNEVSLDIQQGEVFGIVGHNGAGKSTLLKVVSRVLKPTQGRVWVKGRVAPLLELGAGFHPELTGRENIFLNGTLLGYKRKEMEALFDEIVDFAELWDFIDAPLRTYSTGMAVRLGFAVSTATRPDILIVDEVLAVGDQRFQEKCLERMRGFKESGASILLVTHAPTTLEKMCDRAAWLDHGELLAVDKPKAILKQYQEAYVRAAVSVPASTSTAEQSSASATEPATLEAEALAQQWLYPFVLPSGAVTPCSLPPALARYHDDRLAMINSVLEPLVEQRWGQTLCLDVGCNEGYFSVKLAERGCAQVVGLEARPETFIKTDLIRRIYSYPNLSFGLVTLGQDNQTNFGQFDIVLLLGLLGLQEDPVGLLRAARALTKRVLLIETPVVPEATGQFEWGHQSKQLLGSFGLIDQRAEAQLPPGNLTKLSLCPGREALLRLLERLGFARVEVVPPPPGAVEQLVSGKQLMLAAYV
jgi:ABC-type polysaccharide/polyol phosphate transport system ATPase subunit/SAM-dependent methyltransferase